MLGSWFRWGWASVCVYVLCALSGGVGGCLWLLEGIGPSLPYPSMTSVPPTPHPLSFTSSSSSLEVALPACPRSPYLLKPHS